MTSSFVVHQTPKGIISFINPVIYVDKRIVVLNKPPGLVCQLNSKEQDYDESAVRDIQ
jgi:23S rRNA-/tRNA-specific pseudouridylate synthase